MQSTGNLRKLEAINADVVQYRLPVGQDRIPLNELVGCEISLSYQGKIHCVSCGRKTNRSFSQGHCYRCFSTLACCDRCIMSPELCHYDQGSCREPDWALANCMQPHIVYLAATSGLKVGITRASQLPVRWLDQGASAALPVARVANRRDSGLIEVLFKSCVNDRTDWRRMLRSSPVMDLPTEYAQLRERLAPTDEALRERSGAASAVWIEDAEPLRFRFPLTVEPPKLAARTLDKLPAISGRLIGIKGQYLVLDSGVVNIRRHGGYEVTFSA